MIEVHDADLELHTTGGTTPLHLRDDAGSVKLDEGWAPYVQADLTIAMPDPAVFELLDPLQSPRPRITLTGTAQRLTNGTWEPLPGRAFDLVLIGRTLDHNAATVALVAASDEALLQGDALVDVVPDDSALQDQSSLRAVINGHVLANIDATLETGTADADVTTLRTAQNRIPNPSFETVTDGWVAGGSGGTIARVAGGHSGAYCTRVSNAAAGYVGGPFFSTTNGGIPAEAGKTYTTTCWVRSKQAIYVCLRYQWAGSGSEANAVGPSKILTPNVWAMLTISATVPGVRTGFGPYVYPAAGSYAAGSWIDIDEVLVLEGDGLDTDGITPIPYFDGDTPDTALYNYTWDNVANASTSTRTPVFDRTPDSLTRQPGETSWSFIQPVVEAAGLRLFCDEQRRWRLVDNTYSVPGQVTVAKAANLYTATDTAAAGAAGADGVPLWFDACVVKYTWTDANNEQQIAYDVAGETRPTVCALIVYQKAYPGPGAAAYILSRVASMGRVLDLSARHDWAATPGQQAYAILPLTDVQTGYVSSVTWNLSDDTMQVGTRGLIDTPNTAWKLALEGTSWADIPTGTSWATYTA